MSDDGSGASRVRHRFPPLERRGVIAGWRAGQVGAVAVSLVAAVLSIRSRPSLSGVVVAVLLVGAGVTMAFWPIAGRTGEQWFPVVVRWGWAGATGHRFQPDRGPSMGTTVTTDGRRGLRAAGGVGRSSAAAASVFDGLLLTDARHLESSRPDPAGAGAGGRGGGASGMGVVVDDRARTVTAVLALRGHSFALLGPAEQDARVAGWARVLASLARDGSAVHRLQWVESCLPDDGGAVRNHLEDHGVLAEDAPAGRSYRALLDEASPVTRRHRILVAVSVHRRRSARAIRSAGGGLPGAVAVLHREVSAVRTTLEGVDVGVDGLLDRSALAGVLVEALAPAPDGSGTAIGGPSAAGAPWPMATLAEWDSVHTDGTWHATYWVAEWPRVDVQPDFLGPLLFAPLRRTLSVVMEPVDPARAARQVAQARTAGMADGELRRRNGFLTTARHTRERQSVDERDVELADGHAQFRFSGYLGVTADSAAELVEACAALEQAAGHARLEARRLFGQQDAALLCLLPLGRGLS